MKVLSNNLILLVLATVLSISPLQAITASVSGCLAADKTMHHSMNGSTKHSSAKNFSAKPSHQGSHHQRVKAATQHDCCETTACDMTHCAGFVAVAITTNTQNDMFYTLSEVYTKPSESLFQFYPSSLYRPPKA